MVSSVRNVQTVAKVRRLAEVLGTSDTMAIDIAVDHALRLPRPSEQDAALVKVRRIADEYAAHLPAGDAIDEATLYDEQGLYR
jgi:hypothetical protein